MKIAIITDTHVNPKDDQSSSVYKVAANANGRVQSIVTKINELDIDAVVHMGDFVHRIQGQPLREEAVARFREIVTKIKAPLFLVPGNHDEGEKVTPWAPGHPVSDDTLAQYRKDFGPNYYKHDLADARLIMLDSQLFGRMDGEEEAQLQFLIAALETDKPVYVFQHHPFFLESPKEREHYDNLPEIVRETYLPLLTKARVRAVYAGHVHNYFLNFIDQTQFFAVPSTTFVRHDYSELFPFVPTDEAHGRNYASKLGFFLVEMKDDKTISSWVRTYGHTDPSTAIEAIPLPATNLFGGERAAIGVDLRHDWATPRPVPYTALQDEFNRKRIRNDYFTASLVETGLSLLRVPMQDLEETASSRRMRDLARLGVKFIVFIYEAPTPSDVALLNDAAQMIEALEICAPRPRMEAIGKELRRRGLHKAIKVLFSEMGTSAAGPEAMAHYIWTGFDGSRMDIEGYIKEGVEQGYAGVVVRLQRHTASAKRIEAIARLADKLKTLVIFYVRLASTNGAEAMLDDEANARLIAVLEVMARIYSSQIRVVLDTYSDHDRGYYPRTGLVDRAYDLRMAGIVIARLTGLLKSAPLIDASVNESDITFSADGRRFALFSNGAPADSKTSSAGRHELSHFGGTSQPAYGRGVARLPVIIAKDKA